jgi:hypothetical protein
VALPVAGPHPLANQRGGARRAVPWSSQAPARQKRPAAPAAPLLWCLDSSAVTPPTPYFLIPPPPPQVGKNVLGERSGITHNTINYRYVKTGLYHPWLWIWITSIWMRIQHCYPNPDADPEPS